MPSADIQSLDFRRLARLNCYSYGPFCVYSENYVGLDSHNFPNYQNKDGVGAIEKFLTLVQSLGSNASGNDPAQKLAKPLPGVGWSGDDLSLSINLNGTMYFLNYRDWQTCKKDIRSEFLAQGWKQNKSSSEVAGISVLTYAPAKSGEDALYNDDPTDAAGLAMMTSAMQNATLRVKRVSANIEAQGSKGTGEGGMQGVVDMFFAPDAAMNSMGYAAVSARIASRQALNQKKHPTLSSLGSFGEDLGAGLEAFGANMNSGLVAKWSTAGHPVQLLINGVPVSQSVQGVLTSVKLTEKAFVIDDTSGGRVYPTEMDIDISIKNMYGSLISTSSIT